MIHVVTAGTGKRGESVIVLAILVAVVIIHNIIITISAK